MYKTINKKVISIVMLFLIILGAFVLRLYFFLQEGFITTDGYFYMMAGKNLVETGRYEIFGSPHLIFSPGYPILIGIADIFFNDLLFSARFVSFACGIITVYLMYLIGKKILNKKAGLFASFVTAINYYLITMSQETWSESSYIFFMLLILYVYIKIVEKYKTYLVFILGLLIGFLYLIRIEGIIFLLLPFFYFFNVKNYNKFFRSLIVVMFSFFLIAGPYINFLYQNTGVLSFSNKSDANIRAGLITNGKDFSSVNSEDILLYEKVGSNYNEKTNSIELPEKYKNNSLVGLFIQSPKYFLDRYLTALKSEFKILIIDYHLDSYFILLFIFIINKKEILRCFKRNIFLLIFPSIFLLIFPLYHIESRYMFQILIFIILLYSLIFAVPLKLDHLKQNKLKNIFKILPRVVSYMIVFIIIVQSLANLAISIFIEKPNYSIEHIEHKIAGQYIMDYKGYDPKESIIMSRKPFVSFYSGSENFLVPIPYTSVDNVIKFAKSRNVNYIIIDQRYVGMRDNYKELENLNNSFDNVELIFEDNSIKPIKVFKLNK
ncbi:glycosyltransferase family 39 protein [Candidatus Parcubacteria bacterium]|nr:glycosyltransferase family 39 protein [Candidatus Parcubacteria bacterium]